MSDLPSVVALGLVVKAHFARTRVSQSCQKLERDPPLLYIGQVRLGAIVNYYPWSV